jgi:CheY-like chemotaxis protein
MSAKITVLVVEDEPIVRFDAVDMLEDAGMEALEAANAAEALTILKFRPDVSVLFTDVNMAGNIDGLSLARTVAARWPHIKIVVTSGHVRLRDVDLPVISSFLPKPYMRDTLVHAMREPAAPRNLQARAG